MAKNKFTYKSFVNEIFTDLVKEEKRVLKEAARHVQQKMKKKVSKRGRSSPGMPPGLSLGNLKKGIRYQVMDRDSALVGVGPPAFHGHLLEFGTLKRFTKKGVSKGQVKARPFLLPTFEEETGAVKKIMQGLTL